MNGNYKPEQLTTAARHHADISMHKILAVRPEAGEIEIEVNEKIRHGGKMILPVSDIDNFHEGEYLDCRIINTSRTSTQTQIIGHTPPKFAPENGR